MAYYFNKTLKAAFEEAVVRTTDAFKAEGFGVLALFQALAALPGQIRAGLAQDLVGLAKLAILALQRLEALVLVRRQAGRSPWSRSA